MGKQKFNSKCLEIVIIFRASWERQYILYDMWSDFDTYKVKI